MRARSWMAALALIAGMSIAVGRAMSALPTSATADQDQGQATDNKKTNTSDRSQADDSAKAKGEEPGPDAKMAEARSQPAVTKPQSASSRTVAGTLIIAGLGSEGCDVEVKPGNSGCKFRAVDDRGKEGRQHVSSHGKAKVELRDLELRGADRTCTVAITIHEKGRPAKTVYRGFRLSPLANSATPAPPAASGFTFYLRSPSRVVRTDEDRTRK
jgi:hypothetical protein